MDLQSTIKLLDLRCLRKARKADHSPSNSTRENTLYPFFSSFSLPCRSGRLIMKAHSTTFPPSLSIKFAAARQVPPVVQDRQQSKLLPLSEWHQRESRLW